MGITKEHLDKLLEIKGWAQAILNGLTVGDVCSGSPLHLKLREIMIDYREFLRKNQNEFHE